MMVSQYRNIFVSQNWQLPHKFLFFNWVHVVFDPTQDPYQSPPKLLENIAYATSPRKNKYPSVIYVFTSD